MSMLTEDVTNFIARYSDFPHEKILGSVKAADLETILSSNAGWVDLTKQDPLEIAYDSVSPHVEQLCVDFDLSPKDTDLVLRSLRITLMQIVMWNMQQAKNNGWTR